MALFIIVPNIYSLDIYNGIVSEKIFVFIFLTAILLPLSLLRVSRCSVIEVNTFDVLAFLIVLGVLFNKVLRIDSSESNLEILELLTLLICYFVLRMMNGIAGYNYIHVAIVIAALLQCYMGIAQYRGAMQSLNSYASATGSFFNSGPYAGFLIASTPFSILVAFKGMTKNTLFENTWKRYIALGICYLLLFCILLIVPSLGSRASLIGLIAIFALIYRNDIKTYFFEGKYKKIILCLALALGVLSFSAVLYFKSGSTVGRAMILKNSFNMFLDSPVWGVGLGEFKNNYMLYQAEGFSRESLLNSKESADNVVYAFNDPLQFIVENGIIIGFVVLFWILGILKNNDHSDFFVLVSFLGAITILVFSLFSYVSDILPLKLLLLFYLTSLINVKSQLKWMIDICKVKKIIVPFTAILIVGTGTLLYFTVLYRQTFKVWEAAKKKYQYGFYAEAAANYKMLLSDLDENPRFLTEYGKCAYFLKDYDLSVQLLEKARSYTSNTVIETSLGDVYKALKRYSEAEQCYLLALKMRPHSFYNAYLLLDLSQSIGDVKKSKKYASIILDTPVKISSPAVKEIRNRAISIIDTKNN
ncbi:O-antigen ligase family protein [Sphingobacterium oryzagri]|uniref:O-antigen ligase family protein n=1 Tax=Sphingobacterium oryzagri TaxID=3025669 RepID=A0ABY7WJM3_9SPHI|nr:O-antigen ligase family protein [Sphingobacterium sp. KACC 22765]WDF69710.1 O-antigen ligase family protein [Sphingobacterium sp. KACC 22765]